MADLGEADIEALSFASELHHSEWEAAGDVLLVHTLVGGSVHFFYELPAASQEGSH